MNERLDALMVRNYEQNGEKKAQFTKIGVAWPTANGEGYRLQLDAIPVPTIYNNKIEMSILLSPPKERSQGGNSDNSGQSQGGRPQSAPDAGFGDGDSDIPFIMEWRV
ncbi:hypothetical protein [Maritalea porphyrae]|uniref:hypothetical protein n=1 Tax=Maritalea porphyrae TaxID=880732 RepID=UPI0022B05F84|nr:hypothetical protein [Maritalea porphyrae]MCZ4270911.1 hypothetical protein [Maritalea porphyrae]